MRYVFLSYAREDAGRALKLAHLLEAAGWAVWWDRAIPAGSSYADVIEKALSNAACVVVLWSRTSVRSAWVIEEAQEGRDRAILLPVHLDDIRPPMGFRTMQGVDLSSWNGDGGDELIQPLMQALEAKIPRAHADRVTTEDGGRAETDRRETSLFIEPFVSHAADRLNILTGEVFEAVLRLQEGKDRDPGASLVDCLDVIYRFDKRAADLGYSSRDIDAIRYALVAFIDEVAVGSERLRDFWSTRLLQLTFFGDSLAGEKFFTRLEGLVRGAASVDVLRVYYLCLLLGFRGRCLGRDVELRHIANDLRRTIEGRMGILAPSAKTKRVPAQAEDTRILTRGLVYLCLGCVASAVFLFAILTIIGERHVSALAATVEVLR